MYQFVPWYMPFLLVFVLEWFIVLSALRKTNKTSENGEHKVWNENEWKAENIQRKIVKDFHKAWETIYI